jgi:Right handed beta helix region
MSSDDERAEIGSPLREITVGPSNADIVGTTGRAIQIAIDALAGRGGGVVRVLPGQYVLDDSLRLRPGIVLLGDRDKTILRRGPLVWSPLKVDADTSQTEITPEDASAFRPGMGVCTFDTRSGWVHAAHPLTVTDVRDGVLHLSGHLTSDRLAEEGGLVANHFPLILGIEADDVVVDGFTADSRVDDPTGVLSAIRTASVYFWRCRYVSLRNVIATGGVGDGICVAKSSVGATIEHCVAAHNGYYGIHPGSHSAHCTIRHCDIHDNASDGLYICWGIRHSEFTDNRIYRNGWRDLRSGISIGHKDTDNLIARNHIYENAKFGVCFRRKTDANAAHRVTLQDNVIENNGSRADELADIKATLEPWEAIGCGVHVSGMTRDLALEKNTLRETRQGDARTQQHALVLTEGVSGVRMMDNVIEGHGAAAIVDDSGGDNQLQD